MENLLERLRKRAIIRRQLREDRHQNEPDRIADLLDEAANEIEKLREQDKLAVIAAGYY